MFLYVPSVLSVEVLYDICMYKHEYNMEENDI